MNDMALLGEYATKGSETAFETLVHRHVNLVYSAAFRQMQNPALCEEVTQTVFIILARKAHHLRRGTVLSGWLYRTAQFTAAKALRAELRRRHRESEASQMQPETFDAAWDQIAPVLEEAMADLSSGDRNAVVLRYFENKSLREVGLGLGTNERAAQKRVSRATDKLRSFFSRRGIVLSVGAVTAEISANAVQAAPVGIATRAAAAGLSKVGVATSTSALLKATLKFMDWMKVKTAVLAGIGLLVLAGATAAVVKEIPTSERQSLKELPKPWPTGPGGYNNWIISDTGSPEYLMKLNDM
ncbi:MAG: RNA polymerase sigma factor, partial [Limisphaerales bacterium]